MQYLTPEEAKATILKYIRGEPDEMLVDKYINQILDYCHRDNFPQALTYVVAELINNSATDDAPLKSLKSGDVQFDFAITTHDTALDTVRSQLNLYRKVVR